MGRNRATLFAYVDGSHAKQAICSSHSKEPDESVSDQVWIDFDCGRASGRGKAQNETEIRTAMWQIAPPRSQFVLRKG